MLGPHWQAFDGVIPGGGAGAGGDGGGHGASALPAVAGFGGTGGGGGVAFAACQAEPGSGDGGSGGGEDGYGLGPHWALAPAGEALLPSIHIAMLFCLHDPMSSVVSINSMELRFLRRRKNARL